LDYSALAVPVLLIIGLFAGLALLKRHLFNDEQPPPIPVPDVRGEETAPAPLRPTVPTAGAGDNGTNLSPARLYHRPPLDAAHANVFAHLLKSLPGYVVLPKITYDHFMEARDGSPSENTSLQNRAGQQLADFVVCDKKLRVLLVCQVEDGTHLPARTEERRKMLEKAGLRLLRWNTGQPPAPAKLLKTVQTLERLGSSGNGSPPRNGTG